ncbi:MAG: hypothetical protein KDD85_01710 [Parvularculaceae bacterium]|nr:hypothetical protein [Parvularculaceae bacterium]
MLEEFLMKKRSYQMWAALLMALAAISSAVLFSAFAVKGSQTPNPKGLRKIALETAQIPEEAADLAREAVFGSHPHLAYEQRFGSSAGFQRFAPPDAPGAIIILPRYDGDEKRTIVEYRNLDDGRVIREIAPDISAINSRSKLRPPRVNLKRDKGPSRYALAHPLPMDDGGVVFHGMYSPLVRLDACGAIVWTLDEVFHHSIERDADGNIWGIALNYPHKIRALPSTLKDDAIVKVSRAGEILFEKSVAELLIENNLRHYVYSTAEYFDDPLHVNDVQPALKDGKFWKKGDLFLSNRNSSTILIYRPSTNKVVWRKDGPWLLQHDVNILNDREISVFSNNTTYLPRGEQTLGVNSEYVYNFETGRLREPYLPGFRKNEIRTPTAGRGKILPSGDIFVEEQDYGRILQMNSDGDIRWSFINRASDGRLYSVRWARYLPPDQAASLRKALASAKCPAPAK